MTRTARLLSLLAWLVAASCNEAPPGPATPREAFEALRKAALAKDPGALYDLLDGETLAHQRARVREWRALCARGGEFSKVVESDAFTKEDLDRLPDTEVVGKILARNSLVVAQSPWLADATVVEDEAESPTAARLRLRGADGSERDLWFILQEGHWRYDQYRTRRPW
jgi:hypothetical protein